MKKCKKLIFLLTVLAFLVSCSSVAYTTPTEITNPSTDTTFLLEKRTASDLFPNSTLTAQDSAFAAAFPYMASAVSVPDLRKGESAVYPEDISPADITMPGVILLAQFPEENVYLFGYYNRETFGNGVILDIGAEQNLFYFPCRYGEPIQGIYPSCSLSENRTQLYLSWNTYGSNSAIGQCAVFDWTDGIVRSNTVDNAMVEQAILDSVEVRFQSDTQTAVLSIDGTPVAESALTGIGQGTPKIIPASFAACEYLTYTVSEVGCKAHCTLTLQNKDINGGPIYLETAPDLEVSLQWKDNNWHVASVDPEETA